jgi:hypothetical protein
MGRLLRKEALEDLGQVGAADGADDRVEKGRRKYGVGPLVEHVERGALPEHLPAPHELGGREPLLPPAAFRRAREAPSLRDEGAERGLRGRGMLQHEEVPLAEERQDVGLRSAEPDERTRLTGVCHRRLSGRAGM